jgi:hypothetical protein
LLVSGLTYYGLAQKLDLRREQAAQLESIAALEPADSPSLRTSNADGEPHDDHAPAPTARGAYLG